jgi:drug/metabolite transporter (DMT)-like permease
MWFWLALGAQVLFGTSAHVDKHLVSKRLHGANPAALLIFSALFGFVVLPVALALDPGAVRMPFSQAALVVTGGLLNITAVGLYLYAIARDEASVVAPLFQLIPVFTYGLAWAVLGETLSWRQAAGGGLVVLGAAFASVDLEARRFKALVFALMTVASLLLAVNAVVFKKVAMEESFWAPTFWSYASLALAGVLLFSFVPPYRRRFLETLRTNRLAVVSINAANETLAVVGYLMVSYASLLAPVALVAVVGGFQPLIVFALGWFLTVAFPGFGEERLERRKVHQKLVAIGVVLGGTALLHLG